MGFSCGIVGLPNVGKSTLFNALVSGEQARVANFAFCTIDPNLGRVAVPDARLSRLAEMSRSEKVTPATLEVVDIAGLVRGASTGEGLGNRFLGQVREAGLILHVLRCFGGEVSHTEGEVDPLRDAELVETELMLADLESLERQASGLEKRVRGGDEEAVLRMRVIDMARGALEAGRAARTAAPGESESAEVLGAWRGLNLLTAKDCVYVANVGEGDVVSGNEYSEGVRSRAGECDFGFVMLSAAFESEVSCLGDADERREFLGDAGLEASGLERLVREGYGRLGLITFFTTGPKETRAWTVVGGVLAPGAAGCIHSDMERGFIRAETVSFADFAECGGEAGARERGLLRHEGRDYVVCDGDVMNFRFNV
ncbi:MAG: redox-regulated ATPase YchF [Alphaproteobacteria bacterium]|nr:redox-regulated ATPase YchF [Alphaproteobacteria bacterium]MDA7987657.1 redox-regulated ATPase YchF [Alphaproteobacteria bacterium]